MSNNEAKSLITQGNILVSSGEYEKAIICFQEALELDSHNVEAIKILLTLSQHIDSDVLQKKITKIKISNAEFLSNYVYNLIVEGNCNLCQEILYQLCLNNTKSLHKKFLSKYIQQFRALDSYQIILNRFIQIWINTHYKDSLMYYLADVIKANKPDRDKAFDVYEVWIKLEPDNVKILIYYANALIKVGKTEDSLPYFKKALQLEPDNVKILTYYACALIKVGKTENSLAYFDKALQLEPDNVQTVTKYAIALIKIGKIEESLNFFEQALQTEPNHIPTLKNYAIALIKVGKIEEYLCVWKKIVQVEPNDIKNFHSYAIALIKVGKIEEALYAKEKALQLEYYQLLLIFKYAIFSLMKLGKIKKSICRKIVQLQDSHIKNMNNYADALIKAGKIEESLPLFEQALELEPDNVKTIAYCASAFVKLERVEESLPLFEKALQLEPDNVKTITNYASAFVKLERVEESLPLFEKALQLEPDDVITISSYANALIKLERVEESLPLFEKSLQLEPDNVIAIGSYANALVRLERVKELLPLFEKVLQLQPNDIKTIKSYANALIKLERVEESLPLFEKSLQLEPNNTKTITNYAIALMKLGKFEESCNFCKKSLELKDDNYLRYKYGTALEELGQYQQAIEQLEQINLTDLLPYHANVIRLTSGRLYYSIKQADKGDRYFQEAIDNSNDREASLLHGARSILANNPYHKKAIEMLDEIAQNSPRYADALKMLTLNLDSEEYFNRIDSETKLKDTQMLNRAMYHKIGNEIGILKSIAYHILRSDKDKNSIVNQIIEKLENLVEEISQRREKQQDEIDKIPEDDYREILFVISKTAHDISDFVNNELASIESKTRRAMRKVDSESKNYSQCEKLLTQLELTQAALSDLKAINEGITIQYKHFPVKKIFEKWQANPKIENAEIELEITNGNSIFSGDEEKIKSALNEMVENSLKHNSYQQHLIIKMKSQDIINPEGIRGLTMPGEQKYLLIEFSDNGKDIPADKKQWIFQPLTTTSKKGQGSGLGLYIIRKTLIKMQGHIQETGENGVRFEMYVPYGDN